MSYKILVIEDDPQLQMLVKFKLSKEGFEVADCATGSSAQESILADKFDIIILDLNLPDMSGLELLNQIRRNGNTTPVLILSDNSQIDTKIEGLNLGADDYLVKPFDMGELLARLRVILNRVNASAGNFLKAGDLVMVLKNRTVTRASKTVELSNKEFDLLKYLLLNPNKILSNQTLTEKVWGYEFSTGTNIVNVYINYLRNAVDSGFEKKMIQTVRGQGFMLVS